MKFYLWRGELRLSHEGERYKIRYVYNTPLAFKSPIIGWLFRLHEESWDISFGRHKPRGYKYYRRFSVDNIKGLHYAVQTEILLARLNYYQSLVKK